MHYNGKTIIDHYNGKLACGASSSAALQPFYYRLLTKMSIKQFLSKNFFIKFSGLSSNNVSEDHFYLLRRFVYKL